MDLLPHVPVCDASLPIPRYIITKVIGMDTFRQLYGAGRAASQNPSCYKGLRECYQRWAELIGAFVMVSKSELSPYRIVLCAALGACCF